MLHVCFQEILSKKNRSNSPLLIFVVNFNNCLCTFMLTLLRNLQWKGKSNSFLCKRKHVSLICSIKYFLSINSINLGFSVELIKLVVIEYVHYECRSFTVQENSIKNYAEFLMYLSIIQLFFKHSLSLFFCTAPEQFCRIISGFHCSIEVV